MKKQRIFKSVTPTFFDDLMAYKRFFHRNGKVFGPYYYESYRDKNGKVRKRYVSAKYLDKKLAENTDFDDKTEENNAKKNLDSAEAAYSNLKILIFMIAILILTDILLIYFILYRVTPT